MCTFLGSSSHVLVLHLLEPKGARRDRRNLVGASSEIWRTEKVLIRYCAHIIHSASVNQVLSEDSPADPTPAVAWGSADAAPCAAGGAADRAVADVLKSLTWRSVACQYSLRMWICTAHFMLFRGLHTKTSYARCKGKGNSPRSRIRCLSIWFSLLSIAASAW